MRLITRPLCRFVAPTLHKLQQLVLVGRKLLQRLALDARDQPRDEPIRLAHFDDSDQRAILVESGMRARRPAGLARLVGPFTLGAGRGACSSRTWSRAPCRTRPGACRPPRSRA